MGTLARQALKSRVWIQHPRVPDGCDGLPVILEPERQSRYPYSKLDSSTR